MRRLDWVLLCDLRGSLRPLRDTLDQPGDRTPLENQKDNSMKKLFVLLTLVLGLISTALPGFGQAPVPATPENAASFVGDWTISAEGQQGPVQIGLSIKVDAGKVVASLAMGQQDAQPITDISLNGKSLLLRYSFDYQGNAIDASVSLVPAGEKYTAELAFAGGAYTMSGTAEKKK